MRIGYHVPPTSLSHTGIRERVRETLEAWTALGHESVLLTEPVAPRRIVWVKDHYRADAEAARRAAALAEAGEIDRLHIRLMIPTSPWITLAERVPTSVEVHAGLRQPERLSDSVRILLGYRSARSLVARSAAGAFVTQEMADYPEFKTIPKRVAIGRGIHLSSPSDPPSNTRIRVGMVVGGSNPWHGLDRYGALATACPEFEFVVICHVSHSTPVAKGISGSRARIVTTTDPASYEGALRGLDVAVGSLALDRKRLTEAAPLKVRDYANHGIPCALAFKDTNLSEGEDPAILRFQHSDADVFRAWAVAQRGRRLRESSRAAVSIEAVESRRLEAIAAIR